MAKKQKKTSKWIYLGTSIIVFTLWIIIGVFLAATGNTALTITVLSLLCYSYIFIMFTILLYKAWRIFPSIWNRASPEKAIGYLFIPIFNYYWVFNVIWGYSKDYNAYVEEYGNVDYTMSESIFLIYCILLPILLIFRFVRWEPFQIGLALIALLEVVLLLIMINEMCNAIDAMRQQRVKT